MHHCRGTSNSGEAVRHSSALLGGYNICGIAKRGPKVSSTHDECNLQYTTWRLLLLLPSAVDKANKGKGQEPSFIKHIDTNLILTGNRPLLDSDQ